ncbi:LD-carboxypeptidase [Lacihabitans sp. CCS-44]|uniref:S66 peptidase family protein n=1 Tax=Lacihabitans sp. CCS-44 TaxID=2487331 RepID=UPI0020CECDE7|nr:LD-carboxypeptidase [Lacihabitans sp. CCS-44]MCP9756300.1 LD-carboxypeptidase [Lacihabitans sp. CCS-44]
MLAAPPYLKKGDKIAITAPASKLDGKSIEVGIEILQSWGLEVTVGKTVGRNFHDFSDTLENRTSEFQTFLDDSSIKLILSARGGYGCSKIIDYLDFDKFKASPKWICGFSDLTAMLLHVNGLGFQALHGVMAKTMTYHQVSNESLRAALFGEKYLYAFEPSSSNILGEGQGEAIGGNLALLVHSIGSKSDINYEGKILFLEDISEYYYNLDRMLVQLKRAGKLQYLAGLVVGDFSDCKENDEPFGKKIEEIILEHTSDSYYPVAFGFGFGHESKNLAIRMGEDLYLDVKSSGSIIKSI